MFYGLAGGIMIASGIFGLLVPGINCLEENKTKMTPLIVASTFLLGGLLIYLIDKMVSKINQNNREINNHLASKIKLVTAISIHNIPEGLSVGFGCGLALILKTPDSIYSAISLAIGIAIQNIPEGSVVSLPLYEAGMKKNKAFFYGFVAAVVEPIFAILGLLIVTNIQSIMPALLVFASGTMIYVTIDELAPRLKIGKNEYIGLFAFMIGFTFMLILELIL